MSGTPEIRLISVNVKVHKIIPDPALYRDSLCVDDDACENSVEFTVLHSVRSAESSVIVKQERRFYKTSCPGNSSD